MENLKKFYLNIGVTRIELSSKYSCFSVWKGNHITENCIIFIPNWPQVNCFGRRGGERY